MEIASYTSLIAAAEAESLPKIVAICQGILNEEQVMADWLLEQIPALTAAHLAQAHR